MKQIQEWLGHADYSTTANIYSHLDFSSKLASAKSIAQSLGGDYFYENEKANENKEEKSNNPKVDVVKNVEIKESKVSEENNKSNNKVQLELTKEEYEELLAWQREMKKKKKILRCRI